MDLRGVNRIASTPYKGTKQIIVIWMLILIAFDIANVTLIPQTHFWLHTCNILPKFWLSSWMPWVNPHFSKSLSTLCRSSKLTDSTGLCYALESAMAGFVNSVLVLVIFQQMLRGDRSGLLRADIIAKKLLDGRPNNRIDNRQSCMAFASLVVFITALLAFTSFLLTSSTRVSSFFAFFGFVMEAIISCCLPTFFLFLERRIKKMPMFLGYSFEVD